MHHEPARAMKEGRALALVFIVMALAGCGTLSAPPRDQFHRLVPAAAGAPPAEAGDAPWVFVAPFGASGLHGQRALVYAHADGTSLEQYGYHYWIDSPRVMLQQGLAATLRESLPARVLTEPGADEGLVVRGRVDRFERVDHGDGAGAAVVGLQFDVYPARGTVPLLTRSYEREQPLANDNLADYVDATSRATREIFTALAQELKPLLGQ